MRIWHVAALLLIACGGKIATESTGTTSGKPGPAGDDDDDPAGTSSGVSSSGYAGTSSGYYGTTSSSSGYYGTSSGFDGTSSGYSSSSSGGTVCGSVTVGCAGTEKSYKCSIDGPPGTPGLQCYGVLGEPTAKCNCYGTYLDAGSSTFEVRVSKVPSTKDLYNLWQKNCGGICRDK